MNFFQKLFNRTQKKQPEDDYITTITDETITVTHPKRPPEEIKWQDIEEIKLINTDEGPWVPDIWLALTGNGQGCFIPHGSLGFDQVYKIVSKYENFDFENFIKSMSCADNQHYCFGKGLDLSRKIKHAHTGAMLRAATNPKKPLRNSAQPSASLYYAPLHASFHSGGLHYFPQFVLEHDKIRSLQLHHITQCLQLL